MTGDSRRFAPTWWRHAPAARTLPQTGRVAGTSGTDDVRWETDPEKHDYPAAQSFLELHFEPEHAARLAKQLRQAESTQFKAKDVLRASGLPSLDPSNVHVKKDHDRIEAGEALSPVLLVRGRPLVIADGYHRVCAVHFRDEDAWVRAKIV